MLTVILYRGGYEWSGGTSGTGFNATAVLNNGTAAPDTDAASPNGMPWDENARLNDYVANIGVVHNGAILSTPVLTAPAAPGRNPADIAIAILTGGEASGGEGDDDVAGGGTFGARLPRWRQGRTSFRPTSYLQSALIQRSKPEHQRRCRGACAGFKGYAPVSVHGEEGASREGLGAP